MPLAAHSMDVLVNADSIFLGHIFVDGRIALFLLATLPYSNHSARLKFERKSSKDCGKENQVASITSRWQQGGKRR